jgi:hypothetical protein
VQLNKDHQKLTSDIGRMENILAQNLNNKIKLFKMIIQIVSIKIKIKICDNIKDNHNFIKIINEYVNKKLTKFINLVKKY